MSAGFTPGPWKLEKWQTGALYVGYGRPDRDGIDGIITDWPDAGDYTPECQAQMEANARLIAAAPELYEEAEFLVGRLRSLESELGDDDTAREYYGHVVPSIARLASILAKARGEA